MVCRGGPSHCVVVTHTHTLTLSLSLCLSVSLSLSLSPQKAERKREEWQRAREAGEELAGLDKEDDPDEKPEPRKRRFPWQDDDNEPPLQPIE